MAEKKKTKSMTVSVNEMPDPENFPAPLAPTKVYVVQYNLLGAISSALAAHVGLRFENEAESKDLEVHLQGEAITRVDVKEKHVHGNGKEPDEYYAGTVEYSVDYLIAYCTAMYSNKVYRIGTEDCWHMTMTFCKKFDLDIPEDLLSGDKAKFRAAVGKLRTHLSEQFGITDEHAKVIQKGVNLWRALQKPPKPCPKNDCSGKMIKSKTYGCCCCKGMGYCPALVCCIFMIPVMCCSDTTSRCNKCGYEV